MCILNYTDSNEVGKEKKRKKISEVLINVMIGAVKEQGI